MLPKRLVLLLAALAVPVAVCLGSGAAVATAGTPAPKTIKLSLTSTPVGKIITMNGGQIVYMFTHDKHHRNTCPASNGCEASWPPLTGKVVLGPGLKKSLLGTVMFGHIKQITYAGWPLYGYEFNSTSTSYVGYEQFGGAWDALSATGKVIKQKRA